MIRSLLRCIRLGIKAEEIVLAYKAWGYTEEQALQRWRMDLARMVDPESVGVRSALFDSPPPADLSAGIRTADAAFWEERARGN